MKKKLLFNIALFLFSFCQVGCASAKANLTYGTYVPHTVFSLKELTNDELYNRLFEKEETLLLAVYQDDYSKSCLCWTTFENVVTNYINNYHESVYLYNAHNLTESLKPLNIRQLQQSTPALYIFQGKKQVAAFSYDQKLDQALFEDLNGKIISQSIHRYVNAPKVYYVDEDFIADNLAQKNDFILGFMRETCGDCHYAMPNVILPYIHQNKINKNFYLFDFQKYYDLTKEADNEEAVIHYQNLKDLFRLSANSDALFGYRNGMVPTFHYYQQGELVDASVFFNDVVEKINERYMITNSFYSLERAQVLKYTNTVLEQMEISEHDVIQSSRTGSYHWATEKAALHHAPLLLAFLKMYYY
ncbi:MAG: hypothetical protein GX813_03555 [Erysipelotrichia bacterium]|nr:hypothetical protein [Erysipelotrichia bacterium]